MEKNMSWTEWAEENSSWDPSLALWSASRESQSETNEKKEEESNLSELLKTACAE